MDVSRTVFDINGNFGRKSQFSYLRVFKVPAKGVPIGILSGNVAEKNDTPTRMSKIVTICAFIWTQYWHWTDRRT